MNNKEQAVRSVLQPFALTTRSPENTLNELMREPHVLFALEFLAPDEITESVIRAFPDGVSKVTAARLWITNQRVFFAGARDPGMMRKPEAVYKEFSFGSLANVQIASGFFGATKLIFHVSTISASGEVAKIAFVTKDSREKVTEFVAHIRAKLDSVGRTDITNEAPHSDSFDLLDQLERLGKLKDQGLLSDEEFSTAKRKLLE